MDTGRVYNGIVLVEAEVQNLPRLMTAWTVILSRQEASHLVW